MLSVSFSLPRQGLKDTRENILATKEFTVNIISEAFVESANITSVDAPPDVDEWILSGLTKEASVCFNLTTTNLLLIFSDQTDVKPPYVKESAVSFECEVSLLRVWSPCSLLIFVERAASFTRSKTSPAYART